MTLLYVWLMTHEDRDSEEPKPGCTGYLTSTDPPNRVVCYNRLAYCFCRVVVRGLGDWGAGEVLPRRAGGERLGHG